MLTLVEELSLQEDLTVSDGDDIGGDVGGHVTGLNLENYMKFLKVLTIESF